MTAEIRQPASAFRRVVTADTLVAAPSVLGQPLAEPWRRFAAMVVDLAAIGFLSLLSGPWLGLATGVMLIVLFGNSPSAPIPLKMVRTVCRVLGGIIVLLSVLALGHVSVLRRSGLQLEAFTGRAPSAAMTETVFVTPDASASELRAAVAKLDKQVAALKVENRELHESRRSWLYQARSFTTTLGVTFGWSGVYFTLLAGAFGGRTLGKLLLHTRAVKINGTSFTFFDAFVRNGGYVAGVAMGLTGFLKLLWEPNRQAVEDRIASTVVVRAG
jgi:uncharacterized RDD family membrane protein YckC